VEKLAQSPLVYVLAQVRIGAILQMAEYVPQIQERLRKEGYPLFREGEIREVRFAPEHPELTRTQRWHFDTMARDAGFLVQTGSVVFHTTAYDTHAAFFAELERGLAIIHEAVGIGVVERLGLRYVDAFQADPGHSLADYFQPAISGIRLEEIGAAAPRLSINLVAETAIGGRLVVRLSQNTGGWFLPPDLQPPELTVKKAFAPEGEIAVLDYDHYVEHVEPFSVDDIVGRFGDLHGAVSKAFEQTVSPFALEAWK
jgi:uncharacterized protein (TIGR04255 family)